MLTLSTGAGIKGSIKQAPEDFVVMEITKNGTVLEPGKKYNKEELAEEPAPEGKFASFVLQKKSWNTISALITIAKRVNRGKKSIGYAGTKDRAAITVQLASVFGAKPEQVLGVCLKDIGINGAWQSNGVELGSNLGNSFRVAIRNPELGSEAAIEKVLAELNGRMPNYFDAQRFGYRLNNAIIGLHIMKNDFESAVMEFLCGAANERNQEAVRARERLDMERDFNEAVDYFPRQLKPEVSVLRHLSQLETDYANALRQIPHGIRLMFIHAVQALVFNSALEERIRGSDFAIRQHCGVNSYGFPAVELAAEGAIPIAPLVGYETKDEEISGYERNAMERLGISAESFKVQGMPELSMRGSVRPILTPVKDLSYSMEPEAVLLRFSLPSGAYATILLEEFMKRGEFEMSLCMPKNIS